MCRLDQTVGFLFLKLPSDPRIRLMAKLVLLDEVSLWFIILGTGNFANGTKGYFNPSLRRCHRLFWQMSTQGHLSFRDTFQQICLPARMWGQSLFSTLFVVMPYSIRAWSTLFRAEIWHCSGGLESCKEQPKVNAKQVGVNRLHTICASRCTRDFWYFA